MCQHDDYTIANQWKTHRPSSMIAGRLCYYLCTTQSNLPVRDVECGCTEPNYETKTYNLFQSCNQQNVHADVQYGLSHILFLTRYLGRNETHLGPRGRTNRWRYRSGSLLRSGRSANGCVLLGGCHSGHAGEHDHQDTPAKYLIIALIRG